MNNNIQEQDIKLINDILNRNYYYYFQKNKTKNISLSFLNQFNNHSLNSNYPEIENNIENIKKNLKYFLKWYQKKRFICDLYIEDDFWLQNNQTMNDFFQILKSVNTNFFIKTNLLNIDLIQLERYMQKNIHIICELNTDIYYNEIFFNFINKYSSQINLKLKISPKNIEKILFNYQNYKEKFNEKIIYYEEETEDWTEENINNFIKFEKLFLENQDKDNLIQYLLDTNNFLTIKDRGVIDNSNCNGNCKMYTSLSIVINTLDIVICKKLQYEELIIGTYDIQNGEIIKCIPKNISALMIPTHLKRNTTPHCERCLYIGFCKGFCHGMAYNKVYNPLIPIRESCDLRIAKYSFLFYYLFQNNLLDELKNKIKNNNYFYNYIIFIIDKLLGEKNNV